MKNAESADKQLGYSVASLSRRSDLSDSFLRREIRERRLRAVYAGRKILILKEDWEEWLRARRADRAEAV